MRISKTIVFLLLGLCGVALTSAAAQGDIIWSDDFEDGVIDPSLWEYGGRTRAFSGGDWQWSHEEIVEIDGYLSTRVWGSTSGITHGAEGWVMATYDFNDGDDYKVNFTWEMDVPEGQTNAHSFAIQITDGTIPETSDVFWYGDWGGGIDGPGWKNLYYVYQPSPEGEEMSWSIDIDGTNDTATLFNEPNFAGDTIGEVSLPSDENWHLRFIHMGATSAGYTASDNRLNLYDIVVVPEPVWTLHSTDGPSPRSYSAMVYDSCRGVAVLFGGTEDGGGGALGDTWEWDGCTWTEVSTTGPSPRSTHAMAFDESRCVTVLFGGGNELNDTWEWDGITWTERCVGCPPTGRNASNMTYDSSRGVVLLFGGWSGWSMLDDLWKWDGTLWQEVTTTPPKPSPRLGVGLAYDASRDRLVLFGGAPGPGSSPRSDETWELNMSTATWQLIPTLEQPAPRSSMRMVYDSTRSVMVVFGGVGCNPSPCVLYDDTWEWDGSTWTQQCGPPGEPCGPSSRWTHGTAYDAARQEVVLFGGRITYSEPDDVSVGDTWRYGERRDDCNSNGVQDICDIAGGTSADANTNGIPDECDNEPPVITCNGPVVLWSPDHELVDASPAITVDDPDADDLTFSSRVFSDESEVPETGDGTGRHAPDFKDEYPDGRGLLVRTERRGPEDGRFYILLITADDGHGGAATAVCQAAVVPHDQDQQSLDDVLAQAEAAAFDVESAADQGDPLPPPGLYEHGLSDPLGPKQ